MVGVVAATSILYSSAQATAPDQILGAAGASAQAVSIVTPLDVVSVGQISALTADVWARTAAAADDAHAAWAAGRSASVPMNSVRRGDAFVQRAPGGYHIPMSTTVLPASAVGALMGRTIAAPLASGQVVMGSTTARLRGALVGDTVDLLSAGGTVYSYQVGLIADDAIVGGTELLISEPQADQLGIDIVSRIVIWGFSSRSELEAQLAARGLTNSKGIRIRHSWEPANPDSTLGLARTKELLGEFAYSVNTSEEVSITADWAARFIPSTRQLFQSIGIRAQCNVVVRDDLQAALTEIAAAGLAGQIDVANANTYGGCYYPRFNRVTGTMGFLSRHTWGMALDTNTVSNAQGSRPQMNCDVVRIFRKHNFAWGGNFVSSDGMHFEWVGERRDLLPYPSTYCPNDGSPPATESVSGGRQPLITGTERATLFANDGWGGDD